MELIVVPWWLQRITYNLSTPIRTFLSIDANAAYAPHREDAR